MPLDVTILEDHLCFGGRVTRQSFPSSSLCGLKTTTHLFLPSAAPLPPHSTPLVLFLPGLTCTDETPFAKAHALPHCVRRGVALLSIDTSPRGAAVDGEDRNGWDFGLGAGFYINATREPYSRAYRMEDYVRELITEVIPMIHPEIDTKRVYILREISY